MSIAVHVLFLVINGVEHFFATNTCPFVLRDLSPHSILFNNDEVFLTCPALRTGASAEDSKSSACAHSPFEPPLTISSAAFALHFAKRWKSTGLLREEELMGDLNLEIAKPIEAVVVYEIVSLSLSLCPSPPKTRPLRKHPSSAGALPNLDEPAGMAPEAKPNDTDPVTISAIVSSLVNTLAVCLATDPAQPPSLHKLKELFARFTETVDLSGVAPTEKGTEECEKEEEIPNEEEEESKEEAPKEEEEESSTEETESLEADDASLRDIYSAVL